MKKIAFILYVGCVLAFSAFARAEIVMPFSKMANGQTPIQIENLALDKNNLELLVAGTLPTPCYQQPTPMLEQDIENPAQLTLRLSSPIPTESCVTKTAPFTAVINLPSLAQTSRLELDANTQYVIKADGNEFELLVQGADLMRVPGFIAN